MTHHGTQLPPPSPNSPCSARRSVHHTRHAQNSQCKSKKSNSLRDALTPKLCARSSFSCALPKFSLGMEQTGSNICGRRFSRSTLKAAFIFARDQLAASFSEGVCGCGVLEPSTKTRFSFYPHFTPHHARCLESCAFSNCGVVFVWKSIKSRHKLWFRTCLGCRKLR